MASTHFLLRIRRPQHRRGSALALTAAAMLPLLAIVALAVDWGRICVAKGELQHAADAAALAGAWELLESRSPGSSLSDKQADLNARQAVAEYAGMHTALGKSLRVHGSDIEIGFLADARALESQLDFSSPELFNAVRVRLRRDEVSNGSIPMFFARVFGTQSADTDASATAVFIDNIAGFKPPADGRNLPILPFALDAETWETAVQGQGPDEWQWDAQEEEFVRGSDGIPEFDLYPQDTGSSGNRGTVNIGGTANSTSFISKQIVGGVSKKDLDFHGGELKFDDSQKLLLDGDPGISAGFKDELSSIIGEGRVVPVFSDVVGQGGNSEYTIREWAGIRLVEVVLTGGDKRVIAQPAKVSTPGVVAGARDSGDTSDYVFSRVWISQ
jgi:hypothetical protein